MFIAESRIGKPKSDLIDCVLKTTKLRKLGGRARSTAFGNIEVANEKNPSGQYRRRRCCFYETRHKQIVFENFMYYSFGDADSGFCFGVEKKYVSRAVRMRIRNSICAALSGGRGENTTR